MMQLFLSPRENNMQRISLFKIAASFVWYHENRFTYENDFGDAYDNNGGNEDPKWQYEEVRDDFIE